MAGGVSLRWGCLLGAAISSGVVLLTPAGVGAQQPATRVVALADLDYLGAFVFPGGDEWTYSGHALAFRSDGDPAGAADGFPGSLFVAGNAQHDLVGEISIPVPSLARDPETLPAAGVLLALGDITGGLMASTCATCSTCECDTWDVAGLAFLPVENVVAWIIHDWYNVGAEDLVSLGWSNPDLSDPQGVWHIGPRPNDDYPRPFHNAKTSDYLLWAPAGFAAQHLGGRSLLSGYHRESGALGGSQGPTLFAMAPWLDGSPPTAGQDLDAVALVYYPWVLACTENEYDQCILPGYRVDDDWGGAAWVDAGATRGILVFGRKGLGANCYGVPGVDCASPACDPYHGYHSDPYEPQVLVWDPEEVAEVAAGARQPWEVLPKSATSLAAVVFDPDCGRLPSVAYDRPHGMVYVAEAEVGSSGETAVHVWRVLPVFADGFETAALGQWSATAP